MIIVVLVIIIITIIIIIIIMMMMMMMMMIIILLLLLLLLLQPLHLTKCDKMKCTFIILNSCQSSANASTKCGVKMVVEKSSCSGGCNFFKMRLLLH